MLIDLFYLFYAEEHRMTRPEERIAPVRLLQPAVMDKLIGRSDFAQLRKSCKGNAFVSMEAAQTYFRMIVDELTSLYDETEELVTVLTQLEKRQDGLKKKLYRFVQEAQADPAKTPEAIRAAERLASTGEQIQVITAGFRTRCVNGSRRRRMRYILPCKEASSPRNWLVTHCTAGLMIQTGSLGWLRIIMIS